MILNSLDMIIRKTLLETSRPIHWYAEYLYHGAAAIRELSFDTLKIVNTERLVVNDYGAVDLPGDFVDEVALSFDGGILLQNIPHKRNINPLRLNDSTTGQFVQETDPNTINDNGISFWATAGFLWFWNISDWGEPTGRFFGATGGSRIGYEVFRERRQIQLTGNFSSGSVILQYISDGQRVDNASQITPQAIAAIQAYINWKRSPNASVDRSPEGLSYYNQKRLLRARLNDLTDIDIRDTLRNAYTAARKT